MKNYRRRSLLAAQVTNLGNLADKALTSPSRIISDNAIRGRLCVGGFGGLWRRKGRYELASTSKRLLDR
jgi:hypothetical protein